MALTLTSLSTYSTAAWTADKPIVVPRNELAVHGARADWWVGDPADFFDYGSANYAGLAGFDARRIWDGYGDIPTKPVGTSLVTTAEDLSLVIETDNDLELDMVCVIGLNAHETGSNEVTVSLQLADTATFDGVFLTNYWTVATWTLDPNGGSGRSRLIELDFSIVGFNPKIVSGVNYARLRFQATGGLDFVPQVGELYLGKRLQLARRPDRPYDTKRYMRDVVSATSYSGARTDTCRYEGRFKLDARWRPRVADDNGLNDVANWDAFYRYSDGGRHSFLWIDEPFSATERARLMRLDGGEFTLPEIEPSLRDFRLSAEEQPPFRWTEEG
jgi:hypothetical protein